MIRSEAVRESRAHESAPVNLVSTPDPATPPNPPSVLITGGGRGIGRALALRFAAEGARVIPAARTRQEVEAVAAEAEALGGRALPLVMDVTDEASVSSALAATREFTGGSLDVLINNAGIFDVLSLEDTTPEIWRRMLDVNLTGPYLVTREALEALTAAADPARSRPAHIFHISSVAGRQGFAEDTAYCATKYGLRGFADALREELAERDVRVSTVYPGATDTTIFDGVAGEWDRSSMARPEDVAEVVYRAWASPREQDVANLSV
jgi:NAD(P)-dependent dehydrogenase (short-subunit alcohol dehydrogenase family)